MSEPMRLKASQGFWDRLLTLKRPIRRWKTRPVERRPSLEPKPIFKEPARRLALWI